MKFYAVNLKNTIIALFILSLMACVPEELELEEFTEIETVSNTAFSGSNNTSNTRISPNQIVIRYKYDTLTNEQKYIIREAYEQEHNFSIDQIETCNCNINDIELWTINTTLPGFTTIEDLVKSMKTNEGTDDMDGDHQLTLTMKVDTTIYPHQIVPLQDRVVDINNPEAINIAIIDTGIDYDYLSDPLLYNSSQNPSCNNEISGWDFVNNDNDPRDDNGHGTRVSNVAQNQLTRNQVPYQLIHLKAFDQGGQGSNFHIACALRYILDNQDIDIVNMSFGWEEVTNATIVKGLIAEMSNKTLFIASAGNNGVNTDAVGNEHFPSGFDTPNLLTVAGFTRAPGTTTYVNSSGEILGLQLDQYSNFGSQSIDIAASFQYYIILESSSHTFRGTVKGTSYSAGFVSATAAKLLFDQSQEPSDLKRTVITSGRPSPDLANKLVSNTVLGAPVDMIDPLIDPIGPTVPMEPME